MKSAITKVLTLYTLLLFTVSYYSAAKAEEKIECKDILLRYGSLAESHKELPAVADVFDHNDLEQLEEGKAEQIRIFENAVMMGHIVCSNEEQFQYAELFFENVSQHDEKGIRSDLTNYKILTTGLLSAISGLGWEQQTDKYDGYLKEVTSEILAAVIMNKAPEGMVEDNASKLSIKVAYFISGPQVVIKRRNATIP